MAPPTTTVDMLNKMASKQSSRPLTTLKRTLNPEDIYFPPAKIVSSSTLRQSPRLHHQIPSMSRNTYEVPEEEEVSVLAPVHKPIRALNGRFKKPVDPSPLKGVAFDSALPAWGNKVNLDESPSRNTRSNRANPLAALQLKQGHPKSQPTQTNTSQRSTRRSQSGAQEIHDKSPDAPDDEADQLENDEVHAGVPAAGNPDDGDLECEDQEEAGRGEPPSEAQASQHDLSGQDGDNGAEGTGPTISTDSIRANELPSSAQLSQGRRTKRVTQSQQAPPTGNDQSPGRKANRSGRVSTQDDGNASHQRGKHLKGTKAKAIKTPAELQRDREALKANRELETKAEEEKIADFRKLFVEEMGANASQLYGCEVYWSNIGGAVLWLRDRYHHGAEGLDSSHGQFFKKQIGKLDETYSNLIRRSRNPVSKLEKRVTSLILGMEQECHSIRPDAEHNKTFGAELYRDIIPSAISLFTNFFEARLPGNVLDEAALQELVRLLNISITFCDTAANWVPRPSTLDYGTKQRLRQVILPNLRLIQDNFSRELYEILRARRELLAIDRLEKLQRAKLQAFDRKRKASCHQYQARSQRPDGVLHLVPTYDIDEIEPDEVEGSDNETSCQGSRQEHVQVRRQTTEEIPAPPSDDWTEIESTALLNGLQRFKRVNRYENILNYYSVLRQRDIDELISQAKYFKQVMTGPGMASTDNDLAWLLSVK